MPDSHRLPSYALAGTQDAITLTQLITLPNNKSRTSDRYFVPIPDLPDCKAVYQSPREHALERNVQALPLNRRSVIDKGAISMRQNDEAGACNA